MELSQHKAEFKACNGSCAEAAAEYSRHRIRLDEQVDAILESRRKRYNRTNFQEQTDRTNGRTQTDRTNGRTQTDSSGQVPGVTAIPEASDPELELDVTVAKVIVSCRPESVATAARPMNWGQPDCQCQHCKANRARGSRHTLNHGPYKTREQLGLYELNRVSLPGDADYDGLCRETA